MTTDSDNAGKRLNGRFAPGHSGNPAGMKPGTRHRATCLAEKLMAEGIERVVAGMVAAAEEGDAAAGRIIIDRIAPRARGRCVQLDLPRITSAADLVQALSVISDAMSRGDLSAEEAQAAASVLDNHRKAIETIDLERRIAALEQK